MAGSIGPLVAADEHFNHQIVDTHASVLHADLSWTEKVCGAVFARDGSLAIGFGFGKYANRNVVDFMFKRSTLSSDVIDAASTAVASIVGDICDAVAKAAQAA